MSTDIKRRNKNYPAMQRALAVLNDVGTYAEIAERHGIRPNQVGKIKRGEAWANCTGIQYKPHTKHLTKKPTRHQKKLAVSCNDATPGTEPWAGSNLSVKQKLALAIEEYFA